MRTTPRDIQLLYWLEKLSFLSTSMVSSFMFNNNIKVARRRLAILKRNNYLLSFDKPSHVQGRLEQVYYLNRQKEHAIRRLLNFKPSFFKLSKNLIIEHDLEVNNFILSLSSACNKTKEYSLESFSVAHKASDLKENLPAISSDIIPDFMVVIANNKKSKSLLFGELDRGTHAIQRSSGNKDIVTKISAYSEYLVNQKFTHFCETFNFPFKGFRVLFIVPSETRLKNILDLNKKAGALLWLTSEKITPENVLSNIWHVPQRAELQAIVKGANL